MFKKEVIGQQSFSEPSFNNELLPYIERRWRKLQNFEPQFFDIKTLREGHKHSFRDMLKREKGLSTNLGNFYTELFTAMFGGHRSYSSAAGYYRLVNGEQRSFRPDVRTYSESGNIFTEVKASSMQNGILVRFPQVENYFARVHPENDLYNMTDIRYAFFRYKRFPERDRVSGERQHLYNLDNHLLLQKLSQETRDVLVVPSNLLLLLLHASPKYRLKKPTGFKVYERQAKIYNTWITLLHSEPDAPKTLLASQKNILKSLHLSLPVYTAGDLLVDQLACRQYSFTGKAEARWKSESYRVSPFTVTEWYNTKPEIWVEHFSKRRYDLLSIEGLRDLISLNPF